MRAHHARLLLRRVPTEAQARHLHVRFRREHAHRQLLPAHLEREHRDLESFAGPAQQAVGAIVGALTALFAASIGLAQNDIKKVLAYSTVSQLGYMFVGCGVGAFSAGMFHVTTHAFFKALLFLSAGSIYHSVHTYDMPKLGGLLKKMPVTGYCMLAATMAISGVPLLSGFYSKDSIIEAVKLSHLSGSGFAYFAVLAGVFVTAFYSFRMYFLVFHGKER